MKKKIMVIALVLVVAMSGVFAANNYKGASAKNTMGVGLNLGTDTGVGLKFGMGKFDVTADIGLDLFEIGDSIKIGGDAGVMYEVYDVQFKGKHHMPITVGGLLGLEGSVGSENSLKLNFAVGAGLEYTFPQVPINLYFRAYPLGLRLAFEDKVGIKYYGAAQIGALWVFDI